MVLGKVSQGGFINGISRGYGKRFYRLYRGKPMPKER
jgi:hypothetical protein